MKSKTIKLLLNKKLNLWIKSIEDENVKKLIKENTIITGGCIASMLLNELPNDYDIYFTNKETALAVAGYYVGVYNETRQTNKGIHVPVEVREDGDRIKVVVKSAGVATDDDSEQEYQYFEGDMDPDAMGATEYVEQAFEIVKNRKAEGKFLPVFLSSNAITLSDEIQIITRFYGDAEEIHKNFDFAHCTSYWTSADDELILRPEAMECLLTKELRYNGSRYPIASLLRVRKFIERGFTINAGQILKMVLQVKDLDLNDLAVLEDQLVGVDYAYFQELISKLQKAQKEGKPVDSAYILEIIDKVF